MKYFDNVFEGYLDPEEKFYDYRTAEVSGTDVFDPRKTGVSFYDGFLSSDAEYLRAEKNLVAEIRLMSPEEYYRECGKHGYHQEVDPAALKKQRGADKKTLEHLYQVLTVYKKRFPMPILNYAQKSQEGLHRMYVVGEMFGWNSPKHPVLCVYWADEGRHTREEQQKLLNDMEDAIERSVRDALCFTYSSIDSFKDELEFNLERNFEYFDNVDKPVNFEFSVKDGVVTVVVQGAKYNFDMDEIDIDLEKKEYPDSTGDDLDDLELELDDVDIYDLL